MIQYKNKWNKNEMMRRIVIECIRMLQVTGYLILSTKLLAYIGAYIQSVSNYTMIELLQALDWSSEATFVAASFGGELLLGMVKKVFTKKGEQNND